jgi:hypothetical protein
MDLLVMGNYLVRKRTSADGKQFSEVASSLETNVASRSRS